MTLQSDHGEIDIEMLLRRIIREESGITPVVPAEKWRGGTLALRPANAQLQEKTWPIETFFHKVVMLRNRLRTLEQQLNAADLPEDLKVKLQGYITRLLRIADQLQRAVRGGGRSVQGVGRRIEHREPTLRGAIMGKHLDVVPFSGIIRIRDMMYSIENPFRLDQGDVSFDAPDTVKAAMRRAIDENKSHYLQTTGVPRLLELLAAKLRRANGIPVGHSDEVMVTTGGIHAVYLVCQALLEPGDEVILPDPTWPPCAGNVLAAQAPSGRLPAARESRLALRPRRAGVAHHPGDPRDLRQLAAQPDRRRPDPRRPRTHRRDCPRARASG